MNKNLDQDISSAGMDKKVQKKTWTSRRIWLLAGGIVLLLLFIYAFVFMDFGSTLNVDKNELTIQTVKRQSFREFIPVTGTVQPIRTIYLDAREGGAVAKVYKSSGTKVKKGEKVLTLSNSDLQLRVLNQTSALYDQINQTRNSRLNVEQNSRNLKNQLAQAESQLAIERDDYQRKNDLFEQDLIAKRSYTEAMQSYRYQKKHYRLIYQSYRQDSLRASRQLNQIDASLERMWRSLDAVQNLLDKLIVRAPISGQLSTIELNPGLSIEPGERIGQIDILDQFKTRVKIDEYHLPRIKKGLTGHFDYGGQTYAAQITKVYPVVSNGQFKVDMAFDGNPPVGLTRGQTLRIRLQLSNKSTKAVVLPRGGFYQATGGKWVYKLRDNGSKAVKRAVKLGRQNPNYFEVLSGLKPGDEVITSSYDIFGDHEVLNLE